MSASRESAGLNIYKRRGDAMAKGNGAIDYTAMRVGTTTARSTKTGKRVRWIAKCPKCGRNGERSAYIVPVKEWRVGRKSSISFYHKSHIADLGWVKANHIDEHCTVWFDSEAADYDLLTHDELREYNSAVKEIRAAAAAL